MSQNLAAQINSVLAALILLSAFGLLVQRRIYGLLHIFAWQGVFLSVSTAVVGFTAGLHHLYISAILTLALKVFALPYILYVLIHKLKIKKEVEDVVNVPTTMLIGIALVIFSYHLTAPIRELSTLVTRSTLAVALATVMLGLLMMITRKKAITQIIGFLALENGLFFAATSATYGMPLVVELGVALDILI
ncbi:MAG: formate hydrogenlyase, partial [Deltaproteobacteria bacterium]|nr:formate hydrogenlyase [Deltaproteobacteria bacterium]